VVVNWFATKQLAFAGVADILGAGHCYAGDNGDHSRGNEPGRAAHAELLAAVLRGLRVGGVRQRSRSSPVVDVQPVRADPVV
jgi:hypothetical protein